MATSKINKRNPCTYKVEALNVKGYLHDEWRRGYAQERKTIEGTAYVYITKGGDLEFGKWHETGDVKMTKGKWTNDTGVVISRKSFWRRAK